MTSVGRTSSRQLSIGASIALLPRGDELCYNHVMDRRDQTEELQLAALWRAGAALSRNRNFDLYEPKAARRVLRLHLWLKQLERDLRRCAVDGEVRLLRDESASPRAIVLELTIPSLRFRRTVYLDEDELGLLQESGPIAEIIAEER